MKASEHLRTAKALIGAPEKWTFDRAIALAEAEEAKV